MMLIKLSGYRLCSVSLLLLLCLWSVEVSGQSATAAQRQQKRIADCTLESRSLSDCNLLNYGIRLGVFAAPGLVVAIFLLLICPWYCCCKYCCNCCGGRNQTPNFCCPNTELPARYSKGDIIRPKVLAVLCVLVMMASVAWGLIGVDVFFLNGLFSMITNVRTIPNLIVTLINEIETALTVTRYNDVTDTFFTENIFATEGGNLSDSAYAARDSLSNNIDDVLKQAVDYINQYAVPILWSIFLVPGSFVFLGLIAALGNCRQYGPMCLVWLLFLFAFVVWICHAAFSGLSMLVGDFCAEVRGLYLKQLNLISVLLACDDSIFSGFKTAFRELETTQAQNTCNGIMNHCYDGSKSPAQNVADRTIYVCDSTIVCASMSFATLVQTMSTKWFIAPAISNDADQVSAGATCLDPALRGSCTITACANNVTGCIVGGARSSIGRLSANLYYNFLAAKTVSNAIDTIGARFSTCDSMMSFLIAPFDGPCQAIATGLVHARQASGLLGLSLISAIFIFAWGAKRFISLDEADMPQGELAVKPVNDVNEVPG